MSGTMPPLSEDNTAGHGHSADYYSAGSKELATETKLTLSRLEPRRKLTKDSTLLVIVLVGLPARGKSFVSRKLQAFSRWSGSQTKIFNVGKYRRQAYAAVSKVNKSTEGEAGSCSADFFDAKNKEAKQLREKVAKVALDDMLRWLEADSESDDSEDQPHRTSEGKRRGSGSSPMDADFIGDSRARDWAKDKVAIFDATNSTAARRQWILEECTSNREGKLPIGVVFVESICDDQELLEENYRFKVNNSPDYKGIPEEEAMADLRQRVKKYEDQYETIKDDSQSYIKIFNLSTKLMVNHIYGRMSKLMVPALMAWHIGTRPVYLCRPGQTPSGITLDSEDYVASFEKSHSSLSGNYLDISSHSNSRGRMSRGDRLGPAGKKFREELCNFLAAEGAEFLDRRASTMDNMQTGTSMSGLAPLFHEHSEGQDPPFPLRVLASTMRRSGETAAFERCQARIEQQSALNPLDKGDFAGMELEEIQVHNPSWYERLEQEPFHTRFLGGECYRDLIDRLGPVIIDIEQQVIPTLVVSHVSILQTLIAYFRNTPVEQCMSIEVPLHTVFKFTPVRGGGWSESVHPLLADPGVVLPLVASESEFSQLSLTTSETSTPTQPIWGDHMKFRMTPIAQPSD
ncbi:phosphofructo-2-kinase/fructose-2,6-bisphosphatase [Seminavis robusta]|uniref:Phosphofructo-2-kinase/fructose-2,6-bisphosphatas e n=1 Tax=Seminavis robusta TaxID=568900 RepID=A0A9N8HNR6_9STRA|nr:phosphofructo-2-kinase/fructose-2,6-bisphosphatase [Seminavis robusta]|eukprot:Sro1019_g231950.1 phosphofructo-2-kinase/fructose-2,6-bisphosphatase (629) ;mRNA; r:7068-9390